PAPRGVVGTPTSVQNPPRPAPRGVVGTQTSVQNPPRPAPRGVVGTPTSVQNPPQPAPRGAEDTRKLELKREVLLQPEKKSLKNKILQFFHIHHSKNTLLNVEQRKTLAYENRELINRGVSNILARASLRGDGLSRLEKVGIFRTGFKENSSTKEYLQQVINNIANGALDPFDDGDIATFFHIFKYAIYQAHNEMKDGQNRDAARDSFHEMMSLLGSMQQYFAKSDGKTYNFNNVAKTIFMFMPEVISHLNLEQLTFKFPDSQ
ncbi:hypothetical protein, partial [Citrobacter youngae]|uniref:hypothetical protein n=1 Tax=Citrobacter youngae TaxID=133448 RepID=UPI0039B6D2F6